MKILKKYLLPLVILILIIISFFLNKSKNDEAVIMPIEINSDSAQVLFGNEDSYIKKLCYLYESQAVEPEEGDSMINREIIELTIVDGSMVSGIHNILPAERDSNTATFIGGTDGEYINVIATANAEGETWQEQRVYKRATGQIFVGYQTTPIARTQNDQGVYMYSEAITDLSFETDEFFLGLTDCDSIDSSLL